VHTLKNKFILGMVLLSGLFLFNNALAVCLDGQVDVNLATQEELEQIIGIGPTYAERIIEGRLFDNLNNLLGVKGIGETTLQKIREQNLACVDNIEDPSVPQATSTPQIDSGQASSTPQINLEQNDDAPIIINKNPVAVAGQDIIITVGQMVDFDASESRDIDGDYLTYIWNFGEGNYREGQVVTYSYSLPGKYIVSLEVSDGVIGSVDTLIVEVYPKSISISEFMSNPKGNDQESEWIEIVNASNRVIDISGWQIDDEDGGSSPFVIPNNTFIFPNAFVVFYRSITKISLNNTTDEVRLLYPIGEVADKITYESPEENLSAALKESEIFWTEIPTPGLENIIYTKDILVIRDALQEKIANNQENGIEIIVDKNDRFVQGRLNNTNQLLKEKEIKSVAAPTINDIDNIFEIKSALASEVFGENISGKLDGGDMSQIEAKADIMRIIQKATRWSIFKDPRLILFSSGLISSALMAFWVVGLKKR
jgi:hypothetical protein